MVGGMIIEQAHDNDKDKAAMTHHDQIKAMTHAERLEQAYELRKKGKCCIIVFSILLIISTIFGIFFIMTEKPLFNAGSITFMCLGCYSILVIIGVISDIVTSKKILRWDSEIEEEENRVQSFIQSLI